MLSSHWSKFLPILGMKRELSSALAKQDGFWSHVTSQHMQPLNSHPYLARLVNYYENIQKCGMLQHFFLVICKHGKFCHVSTLFLFLSGWQYFSMNYTIPRSIDAFVPFKVVTRLIYWDERSLYFEQSFVSLHDGFVRAVALCKNTVVGGSVVQMLASLGVEHVPEMPKEVM